MRVFLGMILGALLLTVGVYIRDSMSTSTVASGQVAQAGRTIVNWDVAATDWNALKTRAHDDWIKLSSKKSAVGWAKQPGATRPVACPPSNPAFGIITVGTAQQRLCPPTIMLF